jgi:hypothetical protein
MENCEYQGLDISFPISRIDLNNRLNDGFSEDGEFVNEFSTSEGSSFWTRMHSGKLWWCSRCHVVRRDNQYRRYEVQQQIRDTCALLKDNIGSKETHFWSTLK